MASQYITFMIIFTLGLSLVIITNGIFLNLNVQFRTDIAEIEMNQILKLIHSQLYQNILLKTEFQQKIQQKVELPMLLGKQYQYVIEISNFNDNQTVLIHGFTVNRIIDQQTTLSMGNKYSLLANGKFQSTNGLLTLIIQKNITNISITLS